MREGCQQAADLGGGHGDEVAYVVAAMVIMPQACPGKLSTAAGAPFELRRPEGRQARAWTVWRAGTRRRSGGPVVVQAGLVLGGLEAFLDRPPGARRSARIAHRIPPATPQGLTWAARPPPDLRVPSHLDDLRGGRTLVTPPRRTKISGCGCSPRWPGWRSSPAGVSSNTERRSASATKSATAESLLALKWGPYSPGSTVTWPWRCGRIA
jgi:hypothetical protein